MKKVLLAVVAAISIQAGYAAADPGAAMDYSFDKLRRNSKDVTGAVSFRINPTDSYRAGYVTVRFFLQNNGVEPLQVNSYRDKAFILSSDGKKYAVDLSRISGDVAYGSKTVNPGTYFSASVELELQDSKLVSGLISDKKVDTLTYQFGSKYEIVFEELKPEGEQVTEPAAAKT